MEINQLKSLLSRFHIRPDRRLGQNFLLSEKVLDEIVAAAELKKEDRVLEIGPGLGFLTERLAEQAGKVLAIEKDRKLCRVLQKILKQYKNVKIIYGDALKLTTYNLQLTTGYKLIANIPYYLTGRILQKFLSGHRGNLKVSVTKSKNVAEAFRPPDLIVLLLQKEVAERIIAKPGDMSLLSVSVQFYAEPEIISYVGKENFYPVPEVDSAIVRLKVLEKLRLDVDEKKFFQLVKIGFANKRKQLQNNLKALSPSVIARSVMTKQSQGQEIAAPLAGLGARNDKYIIDYKEVLRGTGLNPLCRAQDLSLEDWERLYLELFKTSPCHSRESGNPGIAKLGA